MKTREPRSSDEGVYAPPGDAPLGGSAYVLTTPFQEAYPVNKVCAWVLLFCVIVPGMILSGFFGEWNVLSAGAWIAIATLGAAAAGAGFVHKRAPHWVGVLGGALVAPGALAAIAWWTSGRSSVFRLEIALAFFLGATPGLVIYTLLFKRIVGAGQPAPSDRGG